MKEANIPSHIAAELGIRTQQAAKAIELLDAGNTVPFIARYRKEATGSLEDEQLRVLEERLAYLRGLVKRQEEIIKAIDAQGKLTDELHTAIEGAAKLQELEDLYLPYKQKRRTRAQQARERGLEPRRSAMATPSPTPPPLSTRKRAWRPRRTPSPARATSSRRRPRRTRACAARCASASGRRARCARSSARTRRRARRRRRSSCTRTTRSPCARCEKKGLLRVRLDIDHEAAVDKLFAHFYRRRSIFTDELRAALADGEKRLLFPALEREIRGQLTENAEAQAIHIFGANLRQLLLQPPLAGRVVMGLDPGYRTGCKMAVVDATGRVLAHGVLQITKSEAERAASAQTVLDLIARHHVTLLSIGNGTASYETEQFAANLIAAHHLTDVHYLITNEAGASVYSASRLAKEELPDYDVTIRGAVSIARRVQDPLAELVKIDPQAIGVGQYQHDVDQRALSRSLDSVIEAAVNHVGVDLNTASPALLSHVAGITATTAKNIVAYRDAHGRFGGRRELLKVARLGPAAFTQCAGFLRIADAASPLDNTPVHPESYELAADLLGLLGFTVADLRDREKLALLAQKRAKADERALARQLGAGVPTVHDILDALVSPGRDPRADLPAPLTRQAIVKLSDIQPGTILRGTVRNVTDFGAFVDIGIKTAGLIHISELSRRRVRHPLDVVSVGETLDVLVISVDEKRGRIGLSLKQLPKGKEARA